MRVANFFDRNQAAVAEILKGMDPHAFRGRLSKLAVALAFDHTAATTSEGITTLELATDLLARFYPGLSLRPLDACAVTSVLAERLSKAARAIHPDIDLSVKPSKVVLCLVVGNLAPSVDIPRIFLGSCGWTALLDSAGPVGSLDSGNPFGAAAAACLGVANTFRTIFSDELADAPPNGRAELDVLHHRLARSPAVAELPPINLQGTHLVGLGAIGRATVWTLARAAALSGELNGVDHEAIERTNLQRYVGATQGDQAKARLKTRSAKRMFEGTKVAFVEHASTWGQYLAGRGDFHLGRVAVALDTAEGRIAVQASLPRRLLNAWTQPGDLGVSRHDFTSGPCLACLYLPDGKVRNFSENVADALRLPEMEIREKLHVGFRVDRVFLERVSETTGVPIDVLLRFERESLSAFYSKAVCGTADFGTSRGGDRGAVAVPMAFQSAFAGVLLAAEIVADSSSLRTLPMQPVTKINLLKPLGRYLMEPTAKHHSGRCLCQDKSYISAYRLKYADAP